MREPQAASEIDAWLEALAGRRRHPVDSVDAADVADALLLRAAMRRWPAEGPAPDLATDEVRLAVLLAAAGSDSRRAAGRNCAPCQAFAQWWRRRPLDGAAAVATAALIVMTLMPWHSPVTAPPTLQDGDAVRGAQTEGVQRLRAADPRSLRDRIADELARSGVEVTRYERLGRYGLDAELPSARTDEWLRLLGPYGVAPPRSGGLVIEIEAKP